MVELQPAAQAAALLDAVCDQYERALRDGSASIRENPRLLNPWLEKVPVDQRSWLRMELTYLRADHLTRENLATAIEEVGAEAWNALKTCEAFRKLSNETRLALAASLKRREFAVGECLLRTGQRESGLYLITHGRIRIVGENGNERYEIDTDGVGGLVGEMSTFTGYPCFADVVAAQPVRAFILPFQAIETLCSNHPELEIAMSQLVSDRLGHRRQDALCGKSLEGYQLQQCIGTGAMGVVYEALRESDGSRHAVKMLRHRFIYDPGVVSHFHLEAELVGRLVHPNIVGMHGHFVAFRTRFIVLELFSGADLSKVLLGGKLQESTARAVIGQIAAGLNFAHSQGVLHLDLKPANILVDQSGRVAISDFGLSRLLESDGGEAECAGTPQYMPPEQFMMANIGKHCDWYSLACIAYELVTGMRLFRADASNSFLDSKFREPSKTWPAAKVSDDYRQLLIDGLQPTLANRRLDLSQYAAWARPVPELAPRLVNENPDWRNDERSQ